MLMNKHKRQFAWL